MRTNVRALLLLGVLLGIAGWAPGQAPGPKVGACGYGNIFFGQTIDESWSVGDCNSGAPANRVYDYHLFSGGAGQQVTAALTYTDGALNPASIAIKTIDGAVLASSSGGSPVVVTETLPASGYYVILVQSVMPFRYGDYSLSLKASTVGGGCALGACLNDGRFQVTATWKKPDGSTGAAMPAMFTNDTGYFWFFSDSNVELVIKVLGPVSGKFWVFASGLTNVGVDIIVLDTTTGIAKTYRNPVGTAFQPIQDTTGFSPPAQNANVQGVWDGMIRGADSTQQPITLTLTQNGTSVTGTSTVQGVPAGNVTGAVSGQTFTFTLAQAGDCPSSFSGSGIVEGSGNQMSGSFAGGDCVGADSGAFTATRR
jgi:hypothetical protein